jgi:hypothetical protein
MTMALCFSCGEIKFGAFCPCPQCHVTSCGNIRLDMLFSDHYYEVETLRELGEVIRAIEPTCEDPSTRFWTFMHFISENHPGVLQMKGKPEDVERMTEVLRSLSLPSVTLRPSFRMRFKGEPDSGNADP